jgi:outer membrane protein OmpA-like peptidoglycan-associated protein
MKKTLSIIAAAVMVATSAAAAERSGFYIGGDLGDASWGVNQKDAKDFAFTVEDFLYANPDVIDSSSITAKGKTNSSDFTYSLFVGYQFVPWLAAEATWMDLGSAGVKANGTFNYFYETPPAEGLPLSATYNAKADYSSSGFALSLLPMWPIGDFDLYARLGYYWGNNNYKVKVSGQDYNGLDGTGGTNGVGYGTGFHDSNNNGDFMWGLGAQWTWDRRVSLRFEWDDVTNVIDTGGKNNNNDVTRYTLGVVYRFGHDEVAKPVAAAPVAAAPVAAAPPAKCADSDHDGVCDTADKCPNTPAGDRVGPNGCSCDVVIRTHFAFDSAELTAEDKATLDKAAARLRELNFVEGTATGHTDNVGGADYNMKLSERRAQAVVDYLAAQGVAPGRIKAIGMGETKPLVSNDTEEGRAQNRRVTIRRTDCGPAN